MALGGQMQLPRLDSSVWEWAFGQNDYRRQGTALLHNAGVQWDQFAQYNQSGVLPYNAHRQERDCATPEQVTPPLYHWLGAEADA